MLELIDEFLPTVRKDDPSYEVRMAGLEKMQVRLEAMATDNGLKDLQPALDELNAAVCGSVKTGKAP